MTHQPTPEPQAPEPDVLLGTRAEAQQRVLARGTAHLPSWRDVDERIKAEEKIVIAERRSRAKGLSQ